ncbi:MAG TPA: hypothetical protein PKC28_07555 [Bdellovibrionales bacterium]|mgnify:CR=1 FL=1|nr:hypothetical protein [Bdellovibrionales bacterium]
MQSIRSELSSKAGRCSIELPAGAVGYQVNGNVLTITEGGRQVQFTRVEQFERGDDEAVGKKPDESEAGEEWPDWMNEQQAQQ